ncbi:hypothetical protein KY331_06455, partial [Candidatus Woesearchaeota archaeon]|nr:hypothetical protein [Candidatus Woesearchaeota archaeon]
MKKGLKTRFCFLTTLFVLLVLVISAFASSSDLKSSDSSVSFLDALGSLFTKIWSFFSNGGITGAVIADPTDCPSNLISYYTFDAGDATDDYDGNHGTVYEAISTTGQVNN